MIRNPRGEAPLQTVDRALQVLSSFSEQHRSWSVGELAEAFELTTSTAHRLLAALAARGYLNVDQATRRYSLGPAVWRISGLYERSGGLASLANTFLAPLAAHTGMSTEFAVPDGSHLRCVSAVDGDTGPTQHHPWVDTMYPAYAGPHRALTSLFCRAVSNTLCSTRSRSCDSRRIHRSIWSRSSPNTTRR
ncbi:helix-turn-helix domain-containing protein [Leucobacter insecticola]|uniref:Glycerol operon regulatory protein n=1 Tax=Leucobacter insecticola TaxID=2714934 RepID=A0A6G8FHG8_9MICO|nr:helix-turn-helix domain-containing protein [Leucobacter insecticola]QIM15733.1 helix-turn-helix domain-containing protein [Leucobacter insecticola]